MDLRKQLEGCATSKERKITLKEFRRHINEDGKKYPVADLLEIPVPEKYLNNPKAPFKIFRSRDFLIQLYNQDGYVRISVNYVHIYDDGSWQEGITWDTLMSIKRKVGYGDFDAVEVYPKDDDIVNVANIRHLFVLKERLPFIWKKGT